MTFAERLQVKLDRFFAEGARKGYLPTIFFSIRLNFCQKNTSDSDDILRKNNPKTLQCNQDVNSEEILMTIIKNEFSDFPQ